MVRHRPHEVPLEPAARIPHQRLVTPRHGNRPRRPTARAGDGVVQARTALLRESGIVRRRIRHDERRLHGGRVGHDGAMVTAYKGGEEGEGVDGRAVRLTIGHVEIRVLDDEPLFSADRDPHQHDAVDEALIGAFGVAEGVLVGAEAQRAEQLDVEERRDAAVGGDRVGTKERVELVRVERGEVERPEPPARGLVGPPDVDERPGVLTQEGRALDVGRQPFDEARQSCELARPRLAALVDQRRGAGPVRALSGRDDERGHHESNAKDDVHRNSRMTRAGARGPHT
jgi:hypothetical protein